MKRFVAVLALSLVVAFASNAVAEGEDICANASTTLLTVLIMDAGQPLSPGLQPIARELQGMPEELPALRKFLATGAGLGYSPHLTSFIFEASCRGLNINKDFSQCEFSAPPKPGDPWHEVEPLMLKMQKCVLSSARAK